MNKKEKGSLTIEATISLTIFLMVIITILSFINYCRIQAAVSNAVDGVAKELSQYSYFYKMSGLDKVEGKINEAGEEGSSQVNTVIGSFMAINDALAGKEDSTVDDSGDNTGLGAQLEKIKNFNDSGNLDTVKAEFNNISSTLESIGDKPMAFIKSIAAFAGSKAINTVKSQLIAAPLAKAMFVKHFGDSKSEASDKLESLGVVDGLDGMNFKLSTLFSPDSPNDVKIVVYYQMDLLTILDLDLDPVIMCKEAHVRAWLGGDAEMVKQTEAETEETTEEWSIWDMPAVEYGSYITSQEKNMLKENANVYFGQKGFDTFDVASNSFTQYRSIDPYSKSYNGNQSAFVSTLYRTYNTTKTAVKELPNSVKVNDNKGETKEIDSDRKTRKVKMVIIVPEDSDMDFVNGSIEKLKQKINDESVEIEVVQGYGKSPQNPQNQSKK